MEKYSEILAEKVAHRADLIERVSDMVSSMRRGDKLGIRLFNAAVDIAALERMIMQLEELINVTDSVPDSATKTN